MDGAISPSKDTIQTTHPEVYAAGDCAVTVPSARVAAPSVILFTPNTDLKDMTIVKFKFSSVLMGLGHHPLFIAGVLLLFLWPEKKELEAIFRSKAPAALKAEPPTPIKVFDQARRVLR